MTHFYIRMIFRFQNMVSNEVWDGKYLHKSQVPDDMFSPWPVAGWRPPAQQHAGTDPSAWFGEGGGAKTHFFYATSSLCIRVFRSIWGDTWFFLNMKQAISRKLAGAPLSQCDFWSLRTEFSMYTSFQVDLRWHVIFYKYETGNISKTSRSPS